MTTVLQVYALGASTLCNSSHMQHSAGVHSLPGRLPWNKSAGLGHGDVYKSSLHSNITLGTFNEHER